MVQKTHKKTWIFAVLWKIGIYILIPANIWSTESGIIPNVIFCRNVLVFSPINFHRPPSSFYAMPVSCLNLFLPVPDGQAPLALVYNTTTHKSSFDGDNGRAMTGNNA